MKVLLTKNLIPVLLTLQSSGGMLTKNIFKHVLFLFIIVPTFIASTLIGCKSGKYVTPDSAKGHETGLTDEIRVTPKDFLLGLNKSHPVYIRQTNVGRGWVERVWYI
jgi:hypothetical protein